MPKNSDGTAPGTARAGHHDGDRAGLGPSRVVHVPWGENRPVAAAKNARRSPSATSPSSRSEAFVLVSPRRVTASASRGIAAGALSERGDAPRPRPPLFVRLWVPRSATAVATVAPVTVASGDTMPTDVLSAFSLSIDCQNRPELGGRSPAFACAEEARETRACGSPTTKSRTECSVRRRPKARKGLAKNHKAEGAEKAVTRQKARDCPRFLGSFLGSRGRVRSAIIFCFSEPIRTSERIHFRQYRRRLALRLGSEVLP